MEQNLEKVRTLANDILTQCQSKGLTVMEAQLLPGELSHSIRKIIEKTNVQRSSRRMNHPA